MTPFRDLPIRRKLLLTTLTSTGAALVLAGAGFVAWDLSEFRKTVSRDVIAQAEIIAETIGAPLTFRDDRVGQEVLAVLRLRPHVEAGCVYDRSRALFASYHRDAASVCPPTVDQESRFGWRAFEIIRPVSVNNREVGRLYIRRELADVYARLRVGGLAVLILLLLAIAAAFLTATRMQRVISTPLLDLAETARTISTTHNYSLRVAPASNDELGVVMRAFNQMLDRMGEALERERDANRLKDEFLATLSHELRTPLSAVLGWTRIMRSGRLDAALQSQALETIERNARAQAMLIDDLLDMSCIASGKPRFLVHEADLAAIVDAAVDVIRPAAAAKQLQLTIEIDQRPAPTYGDHGRLQQVVWNLLSNAVKFTPPGGHIWIRLDRPDSYRLVVRDSGPGIDPKFLPFVFQPFRQADGSTTREHGGLGLGLAIAKQLVELHGGTIEAHSSGRGGGATFEVRLPSVVQPRDAVTAEGPVSVLPAASVDGTLLRGVHVLVVDDETDARILLQTTLSQYGATVTTVSSVAAAMKIVAHHPPDVVLSDIGMPSEDGYALIRQLRALPRSSGGAIPAVAVTAYASIEDGLAAEAAGFQAHLAKPFEPADVANLVALLGHSGGSDS